MTIRTALPISDERKKSLNVVMIVLQYRCNRRFLLNVPLPAVYRLPNARDGCLAKDDSKKHSHLRFLA
jgi:hypothetical protein